MNIKDKILTEITNDTYRIIEYIMIKTYPILNFNVTYRNNFYFDRTMRFKGVLTWIKYHQLNKYLRNKYLMSITHN